jgi:hypothetical protein
VTVALRFHAAPEHVRTARLVAVAVARRAGMDEVRLDEIRLAVDVVVELDDQGPTLDVVVTDNAGLGESEEESVSLPLVRGLADAVSVEPGPGGAGGIIRMTWAR